MKDIFKNIYEITSEAKLKQCFEIIDSLLNRCQKLVLCALHPILLTQIEDYLTTKLIECAQISGHMDINLAHKFGNS